jgi:hypothetical protein
MHENLIEYLNKKREILVKRFSEIKPYNVRVMDLPSGDFKEYKKIQREIRITDKTINELDRQNKIYVS